MTLLEIQTRQMSGKLLLQTLLLKQAKAKGAKTIDGITMFVNQAAAQFQLFTTHPANTDLMRRVVLDSLRRR